MQTWETYKQGTEIDIAVAERLGWSVTQSQNDQSMYYISRLASAPRSAPFQATVSRDYQRLPEFSTDLNVAWELHKARPEGTTLFNLSWLDLEPSETAYQICRAFLRWTESNA